MKITIIYRYFWPDTAPYALLLKELLPALVEAGYEISIISGYPSYGADASEKKVDQHSVEFGCSVRRISLLPEHKFRIFKPMNMVLFSIIAFFFLVFGKKQDVYWSGTTPPVVQSFLVVLAAKIRRTKSIYQMQDIYPEIAISSGLIKYGLVTKTLSKIDNFSLRTFDEVVVLSSDMVQTIYDRTGVQPNIINNFAIGVDAERPVTNKKVSRPIKFVFAGNIGGFQYLDKIVDVFRLIEDEEIELHFLGDGKAKANLEKMASDCDNVYFHGHLSASKAFQFIQKCDVGIVSLQPNLSKYAHPTKTHSYFAAGLHVFALVEDDSELAQTIKANEVGISVDGSLDEQSIAQSLNDYVHKLKYAGSLQTAPDDIWSLRGVIKKWLKLLEGLK